MKNVLITVLLFLFFSLLINLSKPYFVAPTQSVDRAKRMAHFVLPQQKYDFVIAGDSRIGLGAATPVIESFYPDHDAYVWHTSYARFDEASLRHIDQMLNKEHKAPILVLGLTALSLQNVPNTSLTKSLNSDVDFHWLVLNFPEIATFFERIPLENITKKMKGFEDPRTWTFHANGWVETTWEEKDQDDAAGYRKSYRHRLKENPISRSVVNRLSHWIQKWMREGIRIYAYRPPASETILDIEEEHGGYSSEQLENEIESVGAVWISLPEHHFEYMDGVHLQAKSARRHTELLMQAIQQKEGKK